MPIRVDLKDFDEAVQQVIANMRDEIVTELSTIGEDAISLQRNSHEYKDQTGNLTSSLGFAVVENGKVVNIGGFLPTSAPNGSGAKGAKTGSDYIKSLASSVEGFALILVAGMEYATYVEAMGKNVLESARLYSIGKVDDRVKKACERAIRALNNRINQAR